MQINWIELLGYFASMLILISLMMSSILKLRWISLVGCIAYSTYGFVIGSLPVALSNIVMAFINIYYLIKIYSSYKTKEYFHLLEIDNNSKYLDYFLDYYKEGISKSVTLFDFKNKDNSIGFYILRNLVPAGIYIGTKYDENTLLIDLDFVIPEYRDFKIGYHIYKEQKDYFISQGYTKIRSNSHSESFDNYLLKMGFEEILEDGNKIFIKNIE